MDKKTITGALFTVFVVAGLVCFRDHLTLVWATPEKVATVEKKLSEKDAKDEQLSTLVLEQNARLVAQEARQDKADAINDLQIKAMQQQMELYKELAKKK